MYSRFPSLIQNLGSSSSYDSDAQAFFTAAGITSTTEKDAWNTFVNSAKSSGYYSKFYFFYPFLGSDANKTKYNAINTSQYTITWTGSITHDSMGVEATAGNSTASTGFNPSGYFFYNTAHIGYYLDFNSLDLFLRAKFYKNRRILFGGLKHSLIPLKAWFIVISTLIHA